MKSDQSTIAATESGSQPGSGSGAGSGAEVESGSAGRDAIRIVVRQCVAKVLERDEQAIDDTKTLVDMGADSFNFVELVVMLERELAVTIPRRYGIPDTQTVETFVDAVIEARAGGDDSGLPPVEH